MSVRCWFCREGAAASEVLTLAVLVPRTAAEGGPALLFRCRHCDVDCLVEKNAEQDVLLSPPLVSQFPSPTLKGEVLYAARKWITDYAESRRRFLASRGPGVSPEPTPGRRPPAEEAEQPESPPAVDLTGVTSVIEAYDVLGLDLTASAEDVRSRYREAARKCHPDRVADLDEEIRNVAERKFRRLSKAYEVVMKELTRDDPRPPPDSR